MTRRAEMKWHLHFLIHWRSFLLLNKQIDDPPSPVDIDDR